MLNKFSGFRRGCPRCGGNFFRRCYLCLCKKVWTIFAGATAALFVYVLFVPKIWLMMILGAMVCGLILWLKD